MTRILTQTLAAQMALLCVLESLVCFGMLLLLFSGATSAHGLGIAAFTARPAEAAALVTVLLVALAAALGLYRPETFLELRLLLIKVLAAAAASLPALWQVAKLMGVQFGALFAWNQVWPAEMLVVWTLVLLASRLLYAQSLRLTGSARRLLVLGDTSDVARLETTLREHKGGRFRVASADPATYLAPSSSARPWGVVLGGAADALPDLRPLWRSRGVRVFSETELRESLLRRIDLPAGQRAALGALDNRATRIGRRAFDVAAAAALLLFTLPVLLVTALLVKLESPGPVLYWQERVGLNGKPFMVAKFRSMRTDAERDGPVWAAARDSRVTRVGAIIRRVRIDELPQIINLFSGDMSLVGPRPERPHFVRQLCQVIPGFEERTRVKPGLTGWAQVNYPYGASVEDARAKLSYDLYYVKHRSWLLDLRVLLATVRVVLLQEGAR
jgi:lipopolysaccharide/colanic/teichoic acid biosynthesis glycosyltransferase